MKSVVFLILGCCVQWADVWTPYKNHTEWRALRAVEPIFSRYSTCEHTMLLLTDGKEQVGYLQATRGVAFFKVEVDNLNGNATPTHLTGTIDKIRQMGELWHCLALVVVSDDPTFLTAFAHLSLRRHALRWSTRILVITRLHLSKLGALSGLLSGRNAMLLQVRESNKAVRNKSNSRVDMYVWLPYSAPSSTPLRMATWTPHESLALTSNMSLFPDKFYKFSSAPTLTVGIEWLPHHTLSWAKDSEAPGGHRLVVTGFVDEIVKYLANAMNFTFRYVVSSDRTFGTKLPDGSWTGLMGMVVREEVDFAPGPFILDSVRNAAAEPTTVYSSANLRILSGLTGLKVDSWGFMLPLTPMVWAATLTTLLGVLAVLQLFPFCTPNSKLGRVDGPANNAFSCVRVILQQDIMLPTEWWWWERLVLGLWILMSLVLAKSYAGNLMSLLAVRYVPQPFQTLRDVVDDPHVVIIGQKHSNFEQNLREVKYGIFREVASLEEKGRLEFHTTAQIKQSLSTFVRAGHHVLTELDINLKSLMALDFSQRGRCDFYISRDGFLPLSASMMTYKTNPLVYGFNTRLMRLTEHGLRTNWIENVPNFTECANVPKKMMVTSVISASNIWGVFVVLAVGLATGLVVWCAELLVSHAKHHSLLLPPPSASSLEKA